MSSREARGRDTQELRTSSSIENQLFYDPTCEMVYGDSQAVLIKMIEAVRGLGLSVAA
jgi:hypothetical protein